MALTSQTTAEGEADSGGAGACTRPTGAKGQDAKGVHETDGSEGSGRQGRPGQGTRPVKGHVTLRQLQVYRTCCSRPGAGRRGDLGRRTLEGLKVQGGRGSWD